MRRNAPLSIALLALERRNSGIRQREIAARLNRSVSWVSQAENSFIDLSEQELRMYQAVLLELRLQRAGVATP